MKKLNLTFVVILLSAWIALAQSPILGTWQGTYGTGNSQTGNFYSFQLNGDGTMKVLEANGNVFCSGTFSINNNTLTGIYHYQGASYSFAGTYNQANNTIAGTTGYGNNTSGAISWILNKKVGGTAAPTAAIPFGSKGTYTKAAPTTTKPATTTMTQKTAPVASGTIISGTVAVQPPPSFTLPANDATGVKVITRLEPVQGVSEANYPRIQVKNSGPQTPDGSDNSQDCFVTQRSITATSNHFLNTNYGARSSNIYPGAIYVFEEFMNGNYRPIEISRNPVALSTSNAANTTGNVSKDVPIPNMSNLRQAISDIVKPFANNIGSGNLESQVYEGNNSAEMSIAATAGGGYAGFTASAGFNTSDRSNRYYFTVDAMKPMFTIDVNIPQNGYFSDSSVPSNYKNLVVIKSVVYGTRVLANVETKYESTQTGINFKAGLNAWGVTANAAFDYLKNSSAVTKEIKLNVYGGPTNTTVYMNPSTLSEGISSIFAQSTLNMAQPIAFVLADLNGNTYRIVSTTDVFPDRDCIPKSSVFKLSSASVVITTGNNDPKNSGSNAYFRLYNSNGITTATSTGNNNVEFPANSYKNFDLVISAKDDRFVKVPAVNLNDALLLQNFASGYLDISFTPVQIGLGWDEWQIVKITVNLQFVDQNGSPTAPISLNYDSQNIYLKKDKSTLRLPFTAKGPTFTAGGAFQP
jgi:hypothetical protein